MQPETLDCDPSLALFEGRQSAQWGWLRGDDGVLVLRPPRPPTSPQGEGLHRWVMRGLGLRLRAGRRWSVANR